MLHHIARQWRMIFSAALLIGLAAFALVKGVSVLAQDSTSNGAQARQTVAAPAAASVQKAVLPVVRAAGVVQDEQATPLPPSGSTNHTVQAGESLGKIAAKYGVTTAALANANGIKNPDVIRVGQKLVIPAR